MPSIQTTLTSTTPERTPRAPHPDALSGVHPWGCAMNSFQLDRKSWLVTGEDRAVANCRFMVALPHLEAAEKGWLEYWPYNKGRQAQGHARDTEQRRSGGHTQHGPQTGVTCSWYDGDTVIACTHDGGMAG
jgi:hypothetical protein